MYDWASILICSGFTFQFSLEWLFRIEWFARKLLDVYNITWIIRIKKRDVVFVIWGRKLYFVQAVQPDLLTLWVLHTLISFDKGLLWLHHSRSGERDWTNLSRSMCFHLSHSFAAHYHCHHHPCHRHHPLPFSQLFAPPSLASYPC